MYKKGQDIKLRPILKMVYSVMKGFRCLCAFVFIKAQSIIIMYVFGCKSKYILSEIYFLAKQVDSSLSKNQALIS